MLKSYITGYILSLLCTGTAFALVQSYLNSGYATPSHTLLLCALVLLAVSQLIVQLVFFLHFGKESKPWNRLVFIFMLLMVVCIIGGSIWIMNNLQHTQMEPFKDGAISPQTEL